MLDIGISIVSLCSHKVTLYTIFIILLIIVQIPKVIFSIKKNHEICTHSARSQSRSHSKNAIIITEDIQRLLLLCHTSIFLIKCISDV